LRGYVWGRSTQPPEAEGLGEKRPAARGKGVWISQHWAIFNKNKASLIIHISAKIVILKQTLLKAFKKQSKCTK